MQTVITTHPTAPMPTIQRQPFNDNLPQYRVCCWHVKNWAYFIGAYDMPMVVLVVIASILAASASYRGRNIPGTIIGLLVVVAVAIALLVFLFKGLKEERPNYVLPYLIIYWLWIGFWALVALVLFIAFTSSGHLLALPVVSFVFLIGNLAFRIWLQITLHKTFSYLRDKQNHAMSGVILSQPAVVQVVNRPPNYIQTSYVTQGVPTNLTYVTPGVAGTTYTYATQPTTSVAPPMPQFSEQAPPKYDDVVKVNTVN